MNGNAPVWRAPWPTIRHILLFDEPFGALDPVTRLELQKQFLRLRDALHKTALLLPTIRAKRCWWHTHRAAVGRAVDLLRTPGEFTRSSHPEAKAFLETISDPAAQRTS